MARGFYSKSGNGKIDRTPSPAGIRKIKRIGSKVFLSLKELVESVKVCDLITPRGNQKKLKLFSKEPEIIEQQHAYEPSNIASIYDSSIWRWRRVTEWHRYINDPEEKYKGTHDNLI